MTVIQEAWQGGEHVAKGKSIMVHFDYDKQTSRPIPADIKDTLNKKFSAV